MVERVRCVGQVGVAADRDGGEEGEEREEGVGGEAARLLLRGPGDTVLVRVLMLLDVCWCVFSCCKMCVGACSHAARYVF